MNTPNPPATVFNGAMTRRGLLLTGLCAALTAGCSGNKIRLDNVPTPGPPTPGVAEIARHDARAIIVQAERALGPGTTPVLQVAAAHLRTLRVAFGEHDPRLDHTPGADITPSATSTTQPAPTITTVAAWRSRAGQVAVDLMQPEFAAAPAALGALIGRSSATCLAWQSWNPSKELSLPRMPDTPQVTQASRDTLISAVQVRYRAAYSYGALVAGASAENRDLINAQVNRQEQVIAMLRSLARAVDIVVPAPAVSYPVPDGPFAKAAVAVETECLAADNVLLFGLPAQARLWSTTLMAQTLVARAHFAQKPELLLAQSRTAQPEPTQSASPAT